MSSDPMPVTPQANDAQAAEVLWVVVEAMERLEARIRRDLHLEADDASPPADPAWAATLDEFSAYADECLSVLSDSRVRSMLAACPPPGMPSVSAASPRLGRTWP
ncbi:hypothetical protein [Spirillospora sp. NPDC048819]|uniref:hypothetical protein n=1 Tax=Spirillospora sp. NPDC048819 TaxID=3155268 RepID=UPI0033D6509A